MHYKYFCRIFCRLSIIQKRGGECNTFFLFLELLKAYAGEITTVFRIHHQYYKCETILEKNIDKISILY